MFERSCTIRRLLAAALLLSPLGCSHRQGGAALASEPKPAQLVVTPPAASVEPIVLARTFTGSGFQFDYPGDWQLARGQTAVFAITAPVNPPAATTKPSLSLDVPKLPWHLPGMITAGMVADGYVSDLKKNQIPDAVLEEECPVTVGGENGKRLTCTGHARGKTSTDVAIIVVHSDRVYILSADSDDPGCDCARKTLDEAAATWKWTK